VINQAVKRLLDLIHIHSLLIFFNGLRGGCRMRFMHSGEALLTLPQGKQFCGGGAPLRLGNGGSASVLIADLTNNYDLNAGDILII
jgi:hypothetical protein